ncbi:macrophage migration inhibitory factor homolog [Daktulosphaira vitifoliae]|uniref:macrophage migration inhibitory factor homolog n=1 Tax=Daktulosphaira vitifoliae TaxID=58002 RepID=UPI0021AA5E8D|nr:macrophage migration inhibitory factor homolog [Daktulosphaira vitifoliae]
MPRLSLDTNLPTLKIPNDFLSNSGKILSDTLGKGSKYCVTTVNAGLKMYVSSSNEPCGLVSVTSIGSIGPEENKKHITAITDYVQQATGIPKNRLFVFFQSNTPDSTGHLGTTFHQLYFVEKGVRL